MRFQCVVVAGAIALLGHNVRAAAPIEPSVVRIVNYRQALDWYTPWSSGYVETRTGTGFVIAGGRIMSDAHVVADSRMLVFFMFGDPNPHEARVEIAGHDCDLALLRPVEAGLLDHTAPLAFGDAPPLRSTVETYGYPAQGDQISSTRGVVSRIEMQVYVHSGVDVHMAVQTDAAINPGASGGPVVQDGKVVGVAFQNTPSLESVGFFIPTEVIQHFLTDIGDGRYDGYPELGEQWSNLQNPAARRALGMTPEESGVRVDGVYGGTSGDGLLQPGDVLLDVESRPIANDGTVADGALRVPFGAIVDRRQVGEVLKIRILRAGERQVLSVPLRTWPAAARLGNAYDRRPRYFVWGGLVFTPLDREMLKTYGKDWNLNADKDLMSELFETPRRDRAKALTERVVLLRTLDHKVNAQIVWTRNIIVERVNGREPQGLTDLVRIIEGTRDPFVVLEFSVDGRLIAIDREQAQQAQPEILESYGVPADRYLGEEAKP